MWFAIARGWTPGNDESGFAEETRMPGSLGADAGLRGQINVYNNVGVLYNTLCIGAITGRAVG